MRIVYDRAFVLHADTNAGQHAGIVWITYSVKFTLRRNCALVVGDNHLLYGRHHAPAIRRLLGCSNSLSTYQHNVILCMPLGTRVRVVSRIAIPPGIARHDERLHCERMCDLVNEYAAEQATQVPASAVFL